MATKSYSLAHTKWMCKYHIVFTPKYRRKEIYNQVRKDLIEIFKRLCKYKGVEIIEGHFNKELELSEFIGKFEKGHVTDIDISQLKMKISTRMFRCPTERTFVDAWKLVLDSDRTTSMINEEDSVYIFIEEIETKVVWSDQKDIMQYDYDFLAQNRN